MACPFQICCGCLPLLVVGYYVLKLILWFYKHFLYKSSAVKKFLGSEKWGLVTGCTSGIGKGFALELAKRKTNVILVSRNAQKLDVIVKLIEEKYPDVKTHVEVIDFNKPDIEKELDSLEDFCSKVDLTVLVNNVGINTAMPEFYLDHPVDKLDQFLKVNLRSALMMTLRLLPGMVKKRKGLVLNLSSIMGVSPNPLYSVYSATKAFVMNWSDALDQEYASKGIKIMCLTPMYVRSNMTGFRKTSMKVCDEQRFAKLSFDRVAAPFDGPIVNPYWYHSAEANIMSIMPTWLLNSMKLKMMKGIRKKLVRRAERHAKRAEEEKKDL